MSRLSFKRILAAALAALTLTLAGCNASAVTAQVMEVPTAISASAVQPTAAEADVFLPADDLTIIGEEEIPLASRPVQTTIRVPDASGVTTYSGGDSFIDASNTSEGYVMVKCTAGGKIKLQITGSNKVTYTYDLKGSGYHVIPLTSGSGSYSLKFFKNVSGAQYAQLYAKSISVQLTNSQLPFLYPNQYVNFDAQSKTVAIGSQLAAGAADELGLVQTVYNYVVENITYDYDKANSAKAGTISGYLPDVDKVLASGKGICFDYAAVMATMLRSQNIPTRLEVGYVSGGTYHAWVSVYLTEIGWVNGIIHFDGTSWKLMDPTFASNGNSSESIMQFIGNGSNYSTKYVY